MAKPRILTMTCLNPKCGKSWIPRVPDPVKCPRCQQPIKGGK